jgi:3-hydroxyacyl-CoA dehydrogenase
MLSTAIDNVRWIAEWGRQNREATMMAGGPCKISSVGIIGAGTMGTSIAAAHAQYRLPVVIHDADERAIERAGAAIAAELRAAECHLPPSWLGRLVRPTTDLAEAARCDLVLESITENASAKLQLLTRLQRLLGENSLVASNTSTIPIERLAHGLTDPSRFCGLHFCHPVRERPVVEVVRGPCTGSQAIATAVAHARRIQRMPVVVEDGPGFVVNRLLFPYLSAALELLGEGESMDVVERAAIGFGMEIGPLRMMDEIGLDTILQAGMVLGAAFPERVAFSPLLVSMVKSGRLGRKAGAGFYSYSCADAANGHTKSHDGKAAAEYKHETVGDKAGAALEQRPEVFVAYRLILPMLMEATRILEEGKVSDARDIDLAVLFGLGFPAEKGGLLWWADSLGAVRIVELLRFVGTMGQRTAPTRLLEAMAHTGRRFYRTVGDVQYAGQA